MKYYEILITICNFQSKYNNTNCLKENKRNEKEKRKGEKMKKK